jgi:hypothetical protein
VVNDETHQNSARRVFEVRVAADFVGPLIVQIPLIGASSGDSRRVLWWVAKLGVMIALHV